MSNPNRKGWSSGHDMFGGSGLKGTNASGIPAYSGPKIHRHNEVLTFMCQLCQNTYENDGVYLSSRVVGGRVCKSCKKDEDKKPCNQCFMIHEGECL